MLHSFVRLYGGPEFPILSIQPDGMVPPNLTSHHYRPVKTFSKICTSGYRVDQKNTRKTSYSKPVWWCVWVEGLQAARSLWKEKWFDELDKKENRSKSSASWRKEQVSSRARLSHPILCLIIHSPCPAIRIQVPCDEEKQSLRYPRGLLARSSWGIKAGRGGGGRRMRREWTGSVI